MHEPVASVVIPAHNEESVIGRCLDRLFADPDVPLRVVVAMNGCTDATASIVGRYPQVHPIVVDEASKIAALNAGDTAAECWPRVYLDADVDVSARTIAEVARVLTARPDAVAAPRLHSDATRSTPFMRLYNDAWQRLPVMTDGYVGAGFYAVNDQGHRRLAPFPDIVADDEFVRTRFRRSERLVTAGVFRVEAPRTLRSHVRRAVRTRHGCRQMNGMFPPLAEPSGSTLHHLVGELRRPSRWPSVAAFALVSAIIRATELIGSQRAVGWNRDDTVRT